jgi:hypothetical protein
MGVLIAQAAAHSIAMWAIWAIVICGVIAILLLFVRHTGVTIPPLLINVVWVIVAVVICVAGIKLIMSIL